MYRFLCLMIVALATPAVAQPVIIQTPKVAEHYIGNIPSVAVRILVLKHSPDAIGNTDADQAIAAANLAASKGLDIKDIGNYHINRDGRIDFKWKKMSMDKLKTFISEQMKIGAVAGDTLIIYTIGHGGGGGGLDNIGQRKIVADAIAQAAEENNQETLWWQLSCHAAAKLPKISSYNQKQQELFSMIASSEADKLSYFCTQGEQMEKLFIAMAERSREIDPDEDGMVTAKEFADFMNARVEQGRGDLIFAKSPDEPIFGFLDFANLLPIIKGDKEVKRPNKFIPLP